MVQLRKRSERVSYNLKEALAELADSGEEDRMSASSADSFEEPDTDLESEGTMDDAVSEHESESGASEPEDIGDEIIEVRPVKKKSSSTKSHTLKNKQPSKPTKLNPARIIENDAGLKSGSMEVDSVKDDDDDIIIMPKNKGKSSLGPRKSKPREQQDTSIDVLGEVIAIGSTEKQVEDPAPDELPTIVSLTELALKCIAERYQGFGLREAGSGSSRKPPLTPRQLGELIHVKRSAETKLFPCPLPGCDKEFKVLPSLKYHFSHWEHSLEALFNAAFGDDDAQQERARSLVPHEWGEFSIPRGPDAIEKLLSVLNPLGSYLPIRIKDVRYTFEGHPALVTGDLDFRVVLPEQTFPTAEGDTATTGTSKKGRKAMAASSSPQLSFKKTVVEEGELFGSLRPTTQNTHILPETELARYNSEPSSITIMVGDTDFTQPHLEAAKASASTSIIHAGGSLLDVDWVPCQSEEGVQFLAVAGSQSITKIPMMKEKTRGPSNIQIWRVKDGEEPHLAMQIACDYGDVRMMQFCPLGCYDKETKMIPDGTYRRIGLLAAVFGDGSMRVFSLPHPDAMPVEQPALIRLDPIFTDMVDFGTFISVSWSRSEECSKIVCGTLIGGVQVYKVGDTGIQPLMSFMAQRCCIIEAFWFDNSRIATAGLDGRVNVTNIQDPSLPDVAYPTRGFVTGLTPVQGTMFMFATPDNVVRLIDMDDTSVTTKVTTHSACANAICTSQFAKLIAVATTDGAVHIVDYKDLFARGKKLSSHPLYKLEHVSLKSKDDEGDIDGSKSHVVLQLKVGGRPEAVKHVAKYDLVATSLECQTQRVKWNPNPRYERLVASVTRSGYAVIGELK